MADNEEADLDYFMRRAREESRRALTCDRPEVAAAHHGLSVRYSAKALMARVDQPSGVVPFPQMKIGQ